MRDVIVHDYFGMDEGITCDTVFTQIPALCEELQRLAGSTGES